MANMGNSSYGHITWFVSLKKSTSEARSEVMLPYLYM